jgi:hypothetical protein
LKRIQIELGNNKNRKMDHNKVEHNKVEHNKVEHKRKMEHRRKMKRKHKMDYKRKMEYRRKKERKKERKKKGKNNPKIGGVMLNEDYCLEFNRYVKLAKNREVDFEYIYQGVKERWNQKGSTYKDRLLFVTKRANKKKIRRIQERVNRETLYRLELEQCRIQAKLRARYRI